jgi:eukaryotic-like serine/threonine-protein kinase
VKQLGSIIAGRFVLEQLAGAGGMGRVYRARDLETGNNVALKLQQSHLAAEHAARFEGEARALAELSHPSIVRYIAHGTTDDGKRYIAMEWLEGEDLAERLSRGPLAVADVLRLGLRVADALGAVHARGIVHRDLKPQNLFLPAGVPDAVKILDFGIARFGHLPSVTRAGLILGTLGYTAPEQARGERPVDSRTDVFALGCILFECLTGKPAFSGYAAPSVLAKIIFEDLPPPSSLCPSVPPAVDALLARMLAKDAAARPVDGSAVAAELRAIDERVAPPPPSLEIRRRAALTQGEQRLLCVVLATGETSLARALMPTLAPHEATEQRDAFQDVARKHGAAIEVLADGSVAATLFGLENAGDQASAAARCGLALRELLPGRPIALAIGRGSVQGRLPVGKAIEFAAAMLSGAALEEPAEGPRSIAVDAVAAGLLDARFHVTATDDGYALSGEREGVDAVRTLLGRPTPCVGRDRELSLLEDTLEECRTEPVARAVLVTGEAGVGKSRLRHELLQRAQGGSVRAWSARCDPMRAGAPLELLGQMVRRAAQLLAGEPLEVQRQKLAARVAQDVDPADAGRVAEFLGEMVGAPFPDEHRVQLRAARRSALLMGDQMRRAFVDLLDAASRRGPLVLVIEDLHWGDLSSVEYIDAALRVLRGRPIFVLALARPSVHDVFPRLWAGRALSELRLGELSRRSCERLAREVLGEAASTESVARLIERSQGNAFCLEELLRAEVEGRGEETPGTVVAMVQSRLEGLDAEARLVLRAGSVFGATFWRGGTAALLDGELAPAAIDKALAALEEREWLTTRPDPRFHGEREYTFQHALVRDAAYMMLTDADRALGHQLAGEWLARAGETEARVIVDHFDRGEAPERALVWDLRAAEQALAGNDLAGAVAHVTRGLARTADGQARGDLLRVGACARTWRGEFEAAERWALEAVDLLPEGSPSWYDAEATAAWATGALGHTKQLIELAARVEAAWSERDASAQQLIAAARTAGWASMLGRGDEVKGLFARIDDLADQFRDEPSVAAPISSIHRVISIYAGDLEGGRAYAEAAIAAFERAGDLRNACLERTTLGFALHEMGAYSEAVDAWRDVLSGALPMGLHNLAALARSNQGYALAYLGSIGAARALLTEGLESLAAQGDQRQVGCAQTYLAIAQRLAGDLGEAEAEAWRATESLASSAPLQPMAFAVLASVLLARGDREGALREARRAAEALEALGYVEEGEARIRLAYAEALAANGDRATASVVIAAARDRLFARAERLQGREARESFLERVPEHARTLSLARTWLGP